LLNTHDKVAYLNCDPGQTELNPAGYLTLHILDQPLLGPNFSQLKQPTSGFYLGDHNVKSNPDYFIKGCAELIKTYTDLTESTQSEKNQRVPLIVNTYGWVKRLGMDCLIKLTEHLKPSHLVQFHSNLIQSYQLGQPLPITPIQQFPFSIDPFPTNVKSDLIHHMDTLNENLSACRLFLIPTISELMNLNSNTTKFTHQKFQPIDHRDLLIYSYFHKNFDKLEWSSKPLQSVETYPIPINSVELWNLQEDCIDLSQVLYAFNLSLVALYTFKGDLEITPNKNEKVPNYISPQVANYPPSEHYDCIGFAIIKSIDTTNNTINLLSPLPPSELSRVRALVKGELNFPTNIIIEGDENLEKLPYFSQKRLKMGGFGASSKKSRTNLKRVETVSPINK
jgi:polynucleotide 5'-hydroxyl-kinase GRC3/NOL9